MSDTFLRVPGGFLPPSASGGAQPDNPPRGTQASNDVTLTIGGRIWSGWTAVRVGRGVERFPSDFELALTERYPGEAAVLMAEPGSACVVKAGTDVLITGVIDRYTPAITPRGHEVRIHGRSRCRALVDCSAGIQPDDSWKTQFASSTALGILQQLAAPFGITVSSTAPAATAMVPPIVLNLGETPAEIADRVSRWVGLLYFDDTAGNMVLAQVGDRRMASGFQEGVNVEAAQASFSADQRFSDYVVVWMSLDALTTAERESIDGSVNGNARYIQKDTSQPAIGFRPLVIVSEQVDQNSDFAKTRAVWEMNRRNGRARAVTLTTDGWRDSAGKLWEPNALVSVNVPHVKVVGQTWVIGEVTYRRDASGLHADLVLMPPGAYAPEPFNLQPLDRQTSEALKQGGAQKDLPYNTPRSGPS